MGFSKPQIIAGQLAVLLLASYTLPLQTYMTLQPEVGANNFYQYSGMYLAPFDMGATYAPFIFRQFGAVLVHLVYASGLFLDLDIRFEAAEDIRRVFFAAIVVNWAGLFLACALATGVVNRATAFQRPVIGLLAGLLVLASYGAQSYAVTGLMDAWTWTFVAALYASMAARRDGWFAVLLAVSVTQREVTPLIFAVWSAVDLLAARGDRAAARRALWRGLSCLGVFAAYLAVRFLVFPEISGNAHQLSAGDWLERLAAPGVGAGFLFKLMVQQNVLILLAGLAAIAVWRGGRAGLPPLVRSGGVNLAAVLVVLFWMGLGAGIWLNTARLLLFMTPVIAVYAALLVGALREAEAPRRG